MPAAFRKTDRTTYKEGFGEAAKYGMMKGRGIKRYLCTHEIVTPSKEDTSLEQPSIMVHAIDPMM